MSNPFITSDHSELETAIMLEKAKQCDLGEISERYKDSVAFTDGDRVFINDDDNLTRLLPDYNYGMLKWLLWHERYHIELKHHNRFFKYLKELDDEDTVDEFHVTKEEVNIIMDILVHDSLAKLFPELVETAVNNLAQFRNRNSLGYTFKTNTLEEMLDEYAKHKHGEDKTSSDGEGEGDETEETEESVSEGEGEGESTDEEKEDKTKKKKDKDGKDKEGKADKKGHSKGGGGKVKKNKEDKKDKDDIKDEPEKLKDEHDKTDWSKLDNIDSTEFIDEYDARMIDNAVEKLRRRKIKLAKLTHTLNGLATTNKMRTYRIPSLLQMGDGCIFKGKMQGKTQLYLVFDASGSMSEELAMFKEIITKTIPQAMDCPCEWFAGWNREVKIEPYEKNYDGDYYKGKFKDFTPVEASAGFDDDGDRTIELCYKAEQLGFSPIGITDGGGCLSWSKDELKQLKRTVLVGHRKYWLDKCREINPNIQIIDI